MAESIPAPLIIDTLKDTFREARAALAAEVTEPPRHSHLGWILSVPDTHQKTVLAALDKEEQIRVVTCATEDEATTIAAGLHIGGEPCVLMMPHARLEGPNDVHLIPEYYRLSRARKGPAVVLVGLETI